MAKSNPLDALASPPSTGQALNFRVPKLPVLEEQVKERGLMAGIKEFDRAMETWRRDLEKSIRERLISS